MLNLHQPLHSSCNAISTFSASLISTSKVVSVPCCLPVPLRKGISLDGTVEWEDGGMDREHGAKESAEFCKRVDFPSSDIVFDEQFDKEKQS